MFLSLEVRISKGGHARNRALFITSGSERGKSGKATRALVFADLALCPHAFHGGMPQGVKIASQAAHVDENRPISGRLGRPWGRPILASQRSSHGFRGMLNPAYRREDTRRNG